MTRPKLHRCVRCGNDVHQPNSACTDCRYVDPDTCKALTTGPRRKAAA